MGIDFNGIRQVGGIRHSAPKDDGASVDSSLPLVSRSNVVNIYDAGDGVYVIRFNMKNLLNEAYIKSFKEIGLNFIREEKPKGIVISLENIDYLSSVAVEAYLSLSKELRALHLGMDRATPQNVDPNTTPLILCGIDPQIYEVFEIAKLNKCFNVVKTEEEAIAAAK